MLEEIKKDIQKLISLYEGEKQRADSLEIQLSQTRAELETCRTQINKLNRQIENHQLTEGLFSNVESTDAAKERIDRLIREIDRCISLMSK